MLKSYSPDHYFLTCEHFIPVKTDLEILLDILHNYQTSSRKLDDKRIRLTFRHDLQKDFDKLQKYFLQIGWEKVKFKFKDDGWRDPNPETIIILMKKEI